MRVRLLTALHDLTTDVSHEPGTELERADGEAMVARGIAEHVGGEPKPKPKGGKPKGGEPKGGKPKGGKPKGKSKS